MPHQHRHEQPPKVRYIGTGPTERRPSMVGGILGSAAETFLRTLASFAALAVVAALVVLAAFFGGLALITKAGEAINPDPPTTTSAP